MVLAVVLCAHLLHFTTLALVSHRCNVMRYSVTRASVTLAHVLHRGNVMRYSVTRATVTLAHVLHRGNVMRYSVTRASVTLAPVLLAVVLLAQVTLAIKSHNRKHPFSIAQNPIMNKDLCLSQVR